MINTAKKSGMKNVEIFTSQIVQEIQMAKGTITLSKEAFLIAEMPTGKSLIQEVETRFGSTFEPVTRCLKTEADVWDVLSGSNFDAAQKAMKLIKLLYREKHSDGSRTYLAFNAI